MMSFWGKLYPSARQDYGLKVFHKLLQMALESLPTFEVKFSKIPTAGYLSPQWKPAQKVLSYLAHQVEQRRFPSAPVPLEHRML